jgi:hypothetical protein
MLKIGFEFKEPYENKDAIITRFEIGSDKKTLLIHFRCLSSGLTITGVCHLIINVETNIYKFIKI